MTSTLRELVLHLSLIPGIGPAVVLRILEHVFKFSRDGTWHELDEDLPEPDDCYKFTVADFIRLARISPSQAASCVSGLTDRECLNRELELAECASTSIITIVDSDYPELLSKIHLPPMVLWVQGRALTASSKRLAVVGARRADSYARNAVSRVLSGVVAAGWNIVSGGAVGVDTFAHEAAMNYGGGTEVVFGSGLLRPYPEVNKRLFLRVIERGGSLISPFPFKMPPERGNFPARNRVIAGLCSGCLVVQAGQRSGALITASHALEEGREVWAVPGAIGNELSDGPHKLLREGAALAADSSDILNILEGGGCERVSQAHILDATDTPDVGSSTGLDELDVKILAELAEVCTVEELARLADGSCEKVSERLFELQILGKVQQNFTGTWERIL